MNLDKNTKKFSEMLDVPCGYCGDIWCAHPAAPEDGVEVIELPLPVERGESYSRCGGTSWEDTYQPIVLVRGNEVAFGYRASCWHGGYNSGHNYYDYVACHNLNSLFRLMKAWKGY